MPARKNAQPRAKSTDKAKQSQKPAQKDTLLTGIPAHKKTESLGVLLLLFGIMTLISLFAQSKDNAWGWWAKIVGKVVGWGIYILPFLLIFFSLWVLLKHKRALPHFSPERIAGIVLLFINLVAWFHVFIDGSKSASNTLLGGGFIGSWVGNVLFTLLGKPGAIIILIAWFLVCLILILAISVNQILSWTEVVLKKISVHLSSAFETIILHFQKQPADPSVTNAQKTDSTPSTTNLPSGKTPAVELSSTESMPDEWQVLKEPVEPVWILPNPDEILDEAVKLPDKIEDEQRRAQIIEETLRSFGAPARVVEIKKGPTITLFGVEPDFTTTRSGKARVRVSKITSLSKDLALALAAARIRIQAPVPGKGYIGIEVPNQHFTTVSLKEIIDSKEYQSLNSPLKLALGKDVSGLPIVADLTVMPHLLIAGTTGAGKSVCINDILATFLLTKTPDDLRLILVDPKRVELTGYNGIPHLLSPVIVNADHVVGALQWMLREMDNRYRKFSEANARNITDYNLILKRNGEKKLPYILVVIDELSDLMMLAPDETERAITRLAQLARATGIHLILATQRPSTDILTGLIKANFPARIAFAVASAVDSRVILDQSGAERLLGRGDMLFQAPDASAPVRIQSAFISDAEINRLSNYWRSFSVSSQAPERPDLSAAFYTDGKVPFKQVPLWEEVEEDSDPKFKEALEIIRSEGQASVSMLQRKMRIGYTRAARLIETMQDKGILSEPDPKTQLRTYIETEQNS